MEKRIYNNDVVRKHPISQYYSTTLNEVSKRDYPNKNYFDPQICCLDLDTYETKTHKGDNDHTVDTVIGISDCANKTISNHRLLLIELRMNYTRADNLSKSDMENKVRHSKDLLGSYLPINRQSVFVFTEKVASQARNWIENWRREGGEIRYCIAWSNIEFSNNIRSYDSLPYVPINNPQTVLKELNSFIANSQWPLLFEKMDFWIKYIGNIRYSNAYEFDSIRNTIAKFWKAFRKYDTLLTDEDDVIKAEIIDEDIDKISLISIDYISDNEKSI